MVNGELISIQIWDTDSSEQFQSFGSIFYRDTYCCVLVYDITRSNTFNALNALRGQCINNADLTNLEKFTFVLLGNKCDQERDRQISIEVAQEWCKNNGNIPYYETSAKENVNIEETFQAIAIKAYHRED